MCVSACVLALACPHFNVADEPVKKELPKPLPDGIVKA